MPLKDGDIVTLDYEGRTDGILFDTTLEKVAKNEDALVENRKYAPITVIVGEGRLVPGFENDLKKAKVGKVTEIKIAPEEAYGARDTKLIETMSVSKFRRVCPDAKGFVGEELNIEEIQSLIKQIMPNVKIKIGHGQMKGAVLEKVILDFINGDYDVLLSTTIIGNGVDIPNANTMIINNAHQFGLSDLHQIRGRVGRSNQQSFCYLISPPIEKLKKDAHDRLLAIEKFSNLGDGFHIAMKDLEIRGAGDVLGAEQSGFINDVGFHTYQKILNDTVEELKVETASKNQKINSLKKKNECTIDSDLELIIPSNYIEDVTERLYIYNKISSIQILKDLKRQKEIVTDRFGKPPLQFNHLIDSIKLKWQAEAIGIKKIILKQKKMILVFPEKKEEAFYKSSAFINILNTIQKEPDFFNLKEKNNKLNIYVNSNIYSVNDAQKVLNKFEKINNLE